MSVSSLVETQDCMIGSAIELEKRSLDSVGEFNKLIQDGFGVRGSMPLIGKCTTKVPNCPRACRLGVIPQGERSEMPPTKIIITIKMGFKRKYSYDMKHPPTYRKCAQGGVELSDKIAKHSSRCLEHDILIFCCIAKPIGRRRLALRQPSLEHSCERTAAANRDLAVPVGFREFILEACATTKTVEVLGKTCEAIDGIFIGIATVARRAGAGTTAEPFALRLCEVLLQSRESSLVVGDGFGDLLLRRLVKLVFEQECARQQ